MFTISFYCVLTTHINLHFSSNFNRGFGPLLELVTLIAITQNDKNWHFDAKEFCTLLTGNHWVLNWPKELAFHVLLSARATHYLLYKCIVRLYIFVAYKTECVDRHEIFGSPGICIILLYPCQDQAVLVYRFINLAFYKYLLHYIFTYFILETFSCRHVRASVGVCTLFIVLIS